MRRRLWLLDLALLGGILFCASVMHDRWEMAKEREEALLRAIVRPLPPQALAPIPAVGPSTAANYLDVAQRFLFSRDRNPSVVLDPPPPPPPPKPMPALPLAYGVLDLGDGPQIFLVEKAGAPQKAYKAGDKIGDFTLISVSTTEVVFDWEGKEVRKRYDELVDRNIYAQKAPAPAKRAAGGTTPLPTTLAPAKAGPGEKLGAASRACVPGDTTPAGTIQDGFKKVMNRTPFGEVCRWEAVQ